MANTDLIIPIVVAVIGLLGSVFSLFVSWRNDKHAGIAQDKLADRQDTLTKRQGDIQHQLTEHEGDVKRKLADYQKRLDHTQTVSNLTTKYGQPLLVAAYDLQQRLFELVEYPISRQALSKPEGLLDLKTFTCYLLAQYFAYVYILRVKVSYLSFDKSLELHDLRDALYLIDEEFDRRRDENGDNVGVWPASRILVSERMLIKGNKRTANAALDGGLGVEVKGFDEFNKEWKRNFFEPMGYFCDWIDQMLEGRIYPVNYSDAPIRVLQHLLVDLIALLDQDKAYIPSDPQELRCKKSPRGCVCQGTECTNRGNIAIILRDKQGSRKNDAGLWPRDGKWRDERPSHKRPDHDCSEGYDLEAAREMTCTVDLT